MAEAGDSKTLSNLFNKEGNHKNLNVLYLVQNVYNKSKIKRTVSLKIYYNVVFRNERNASQFWSLAYQMHPGDASWLLDAFNDATKNLSAT